MYKNNQEMIFLKRLHAKEVNKKFHFYSKQSKLSRVHQGKIGHGGKLENC